MIVPFPFSREYTLVPSSYSCILDSINDKNAKSLKEENLMSDIITHIIPPARVAKRVRSEKVEARKTACHHRLPTVCPWRKERSNQENCHYTH